MASKAAHMQLVNHGLGKGPLERQIALPIVPIGIGYDAFHGHSGIVTRPRRSPAVVCFWDGHSKPVRVKQHFLGVEPTSALRVEGPVSAIGVHLAWPKARHKDMPVVMRAMFIGIEWDDPCGLRGILVIE